VNPQPATRPAPAAREPSLPPCAGPGKEEEAVAALGMSVRGRQHRSERGEVVERIDPRR
jgi:hypothetical protein